MGGLGRKRYDQPLVAGSGMVDGMGFAVGRTGTDKPGTEYRMCWRSAGPTTLAISGRFGIDVAQGKAASGARSTSGCCRPSPRLCGSPAGLPADSDDAVQAYWT